MPNRSDVAKYIGAFFFRDDISALLHKVTSREFKKGTSPSRCLIYSIGETYSLFKEENKHFEVSLNEFAEYLPNRIILASIGEQGICYCCENIKKLFNSKAFFDETGGEFQVLNDLISTLVCDPCSEHCMRHHCAKCNVWDKLSFIIEKSFDCCREANFNCYQWNSQRLSLEYFNLEKLSDQFMSQMLVYTDHLFVTQQQSKKLSAQISSLREGQIIFMMNVANLSDCFRHYLKRDTSPCGKKFKKRKMIDLVIYDVIVYYKKCGKVNKLSYAVFTNISQCAAYEIWTFNSYIFEDLKAQSVKMSSVILWSNNDKRYFKNTESMAILTHMFIFGTSATWNFHCNNHDRHEHDKVTAVVKTNISNYCKDNISKIENAKDLASKLKNKVLPVKLLYVSKKEVIEHKEVFEKIVDNVGPVLKLQSAQRIIPVGAYSILIEKSVTDVASNTEKINFAPGCKFYQQSQPLTVDGIITDDQHLNISSESPSMFQELNTPAQDYSEGDIKPSIVINDSQETYEYGRMRLVYNSKKNELTHIVKNKLVSKLIGNLRSGPLNIKTEFNEENEDLEIVNNETCNGVYIKQELVNDLEEVEQADCEKLKLLSEEIKDPIFVNEETFSMVDNDHETFEVASGSSSTSSKLKSTNLTQTCISNCDVSTKNIIGKSSFRRIAPSEMNIKKESKYSNKVPLRNDSQKLERIRRTIEKVIADVSQELSDSENIDEKILYREITNCPGEVVYGKANHSTCKVEETDGSYCEHDKVTVVNDEFSSHCNEISIDSKNPYCGAGNDCLSDSPNMAVKLTDVANLTFPCIDNINSPNHKNDDESKENNVHCESDEIGEYTNYFSAKEAEPSVSGEELQMTDDSSTSVTADKEKYHVLINKKTIFSTSDTVDCQKESETYSDYQPIFMSEVGNTASPRLTNILTNETSNISKDITCNSPNDNSNPKTLSILRLFRKSKSISVDEDKSNTSADILEHNSIGVVEECSIDKWISAKKTETITAELAEDKSLPFEDKLSKMVLKKRKISDCIKKKRGRKRKKRKLTPSPTFEIESCDEELKQNGKEQIFENKTGTDLEDNDSLTASSLQPSTELVEPKTVDEIQQRINDSSMTRHFLDEMDDDMVDESSARQNESDSDEDWDDLNEYLDVSAFEDHDENFDLKKTIDGNKGHKTFIDEDNDSNELREEPILDEDGSLMRDLNAILDAENDDNPFQCPDCDQVLSSRGNLKRHVNTIHRGLRPFMCPECSASFSEKRSMELHIVNVHDKIRPYICSDCGKSYSSKTSLSTHIKSIHVGLKPYPCTECNPTRYFARLPCLKLHNERWHNPDRDPPTHIREVVPRNYSCPICQSVFSSTNSVKKHVMFVHEKLKAFQCSICLSNFRDYGNLRRHHTAIHEGIKPYKCDKCTTTFSDRWGLRKHKENIHMGVKNHVCHVCHFPFSEKSNMLRHFATVHEGVKPFECKDCDTKYTQKASLKHHLAAVHNKTIEEAVSEGQLTSNFGTSSDEKKTD